MLSLSRIIKPWQESGALNAQINLYGFWNDEVFLTKSGDLGVVLRVRGVDYESLDHAAQEYAVKRLEAALKTFGPGFHIYQYLFKTNRPEIPFQQYDDPVVQAAVDQRKTFFDGKLDRLFDVEIFYAIVIEGTRSKTGLAAALKQLPTDPMAGWRELRAQFSNDKLKILLREQIEADLLRLEQRVVSFVRQLSDFAQIETLQQNDCFRFLRRLLNYDRWRIEGKPQSSQFLDYQVANSNIEAERDHLRVGDHFVRILTMKEAVSETKPLVLKQLLEIQANFCVVTEWVPIENAIARKEITKRKRHFNVSKSSFISSMQRDPAAYDPRNVIIDEAKQADIENLGDCLRSLGDGQSLGDFSLTIVLYAEDKKTLDRALPEVVRVFTSADGNLFAETYNQLNAYFATVPGNYRHNLRKLYLLNSNYADLSFLFTIHPGETWNDHLCAEYLAALETDQATPYFLNLHNRDVAHTLVLGATGSGKTIKLLHIAFDLCVRRAERVVILTYNRLLVSDIRRMLALAGIDSALDHSTIEIETIHAYILHVLKSFGFEFSYADYLQRYVEWKKILLDYVDAQVITADDVAEQRKAGANEFCWDKLLIDEGQDWPDDERRILFALFDPRNVVVACGTGQMVRSNSYADWTRGVDFHKPIVYEKKSLRQKKESL